MEPKKDYYKILGLDVTASTEDIRNVYVKLAGLYHPDKHPGDMERLEKFLEIVEAYKVLGDLDSRLKYTIEINKKLKIPREFSE